jgi:molybdopterin converting factor small subunit
VSVVTVQLFAAYADLVGSSTLDIPLRHGDTVRDVIHRIRSLPAASGLPPIPRVAVNRSFVTEDTALCLTDEIAIIPPVAGG